LLIIKLSRAPVTCSLCTLCALKENHSVRSCIFAMLACRAFRKVCMCRFASHAYGPAQGAVPFWGLTRCRAEMHAPYGRGPSALGTSGRGYAALPLRLGTRVLIFDVTIIFLLMPSYVLSHKNCREESTNDQPCCA